MKPSLGLFAAAALLATIGSAPAHAELLNFDLSGSRDAMFQLDSNPSPSSFSSSFIGDQIAFTNVAGTFGGVAGLADISFGSGPILADLNIDGTPLGFTQFAGPTLFSGSAASPVFSTGTFALTSIVSGNSTLVISGVSAAPEPSAWMLMIAGVGMVGGMMRYAHRGQRAPSPAA